MTADVSPGAPSLGKGAATVAIATAVSRITGFLRVIAVAAAMGTTFVANTYNSANAAPNLIFELLAAGVLTSIFVPTFVDYLVNRSRQEGWEAANALTSVALIGLTGVALVVAFAAPLIMRILLVGVDPTVKPDAVALGSDLLRLFAPQIVFYGAGMIMTGALHAHRRFGLPAIAPIFNNLVVIAVYLTYAAMRGAETPDVRTISTSEVFLLGAGTTAGVVAMTLCLLPSLRGLGWRFRFKPDVRHPAVKKGARMGIWALGYAGGYQAGLVLVLILANRVEGGVAAYQWAYTYFYLPHALFGVPIFNVLFTAMSEHVARTEWKGMAERLGSGMAMLVFILVPISVGLAVSAAPLAHVTLRYGVMTQEGVDLVAGAISAFALGLPAFSAFLVFTRAFYALGDARTPALVNALLVVVAGGSGALLFFSLDEGNRVQGLALGHSIGAWVGALTLGVLLARAVGAGYIDRVRQSIVQIAVLAAAAGLAMTGVLRWADVTGRQGALLELMLAGAAGCLVYCSGAAVLKLEEWHTLTRTVRSLVGR